MYQRENLVALMYANNNAYTTVVEADDLKVTEAGVTVDPEKGIWSSPIPYRHNIKIGNSVYHERQRRWGVIGIYDKTNIDHLKLMVRGSQSATDSGSYD